MITSVKEKYFLNEKIAKKLFKNEKLGKCLSARLISDILDADYNEVYNSITLSTDEIAFSALTVNSTSDAIYYNDKIYFDIEINGYSGISKERQLESYVYQLYLGQLHTYNDYNKIKKVFQISIDAYDFLGYGDFIYNVYLMNDKYQQIVSDKLQIMHINLDYLRNLAYTEIVKENNKLMSDLYFLICGYDNLDVVLENGDKLMKEIIDEAKQISGIEKMNLYLTDEEMMKNDQAYYKELGREEKEHEMIINFYNNGVSLELISKSSGLTIKEIEKIIKEEQSK